MRPLGCALTLLGLLASRPALAASCSVSSSGVNFGAYDPADAADTRGTGTVRLSCDAAVTASVALSGGGRSATDHAMSNGISQLGYGLYTDAQRSTLWGDGTGGSQTVAFDGTVVDRSVYGAIPARQRVTAGSYADTITLTVSY
ncbi:Csu type fimbrial protein [Sphingomonas sp. PAMC 26605]|uniref:Csu type fimbrial protein n=1 Tax=Sphingomonas sp. PAMC 26605 TaxID=1112214 RepID=UPI00026CCA6B|nr:spore coat U domain-containing protein [Sphingomonas sp. PAMC 26605]